MSTKATAGCTSVEQSLQQKVILACAENLGKNIVLMKFVALRTFEKMTRALLYWIWESSNFRSWKVVHAMRWSTFAPDITSFKT